MTKDYKETSNEHPLVSVVISTKNEALHIDQCIVSIENQTYPNIEIIVVDNWSTDGTLDIARSHGCKTAVMGPERSAQRNHGLLTLAQGSIGAYIDADMALGTAVVAQAVQILKEPTVAGVYVPERVVGPGFFAKVRDFERSFYDGTAIDAVRFFRLEDFAAIGGFDERLFTSGSGEDWDLDNCLEKLGRLEKLSRLHEGSFRSIRTSGMQDILAQSEFASCIIHDESDIGLSEYLRKKKYYITGFAGYQSKWTRNHPRVSLQFSARYRLLGVFIESAGWRKVMRHPLLAAGVVSTRMLVGLRYLASLL